MTGTPMNARAPRLARRLALCLFLPLAALPLGGIDSFEALFAPSSDLWPRWQAHDPSATTRLDHGVWDGLVTRYRREAPDNIARFAYGAVTEADRRALDGYIASLAATPVSGLARPEQFAYWVNFYNALTVQVVLDHYPVDSIRDIDISPGLFASGPWDKELVTVEGEEVSLNDIEHRILRPIWNDPRLHYVINCAALGCPDLPPQALTAENTETLLDEGARRYVNHPRGVTVTGDRIAVSSIYAWFSEDFGREDQAILAHLRQHAAPALAQRLAGLKAIADHDYDWRLNDAAR